MIKQGLVKTGQMSLGEQAEVEALVTLCREQDRLELPLYLESAPPGTVCQLLHYDDNNLVGFASLPPDGDIEVIGMVHPAHRRRGVGRALLAAVREECRRRGVAEFLMVCEEASASGQAFAGAVGADYRFSEYLMEVEQAAFGQLQPPPKTVEIRQATGQDLETLVDLWAASHPEREAERRPMIAQWLQQEKQRFFIGQVQGAAVGMLRLHMDAPSVFINSFNVRPEHRRRGYGRQILMAVVERLIAEGWEYIRLEVATENRNALSLYYGCGFQEVTAYRYYRLTVYQASKHKL